MSFTTAKVIRILDRGVLVRDNYNTFVRVLWDDIMVEDREVLQEGSQVIISDYGTLELATSSFNRYRDEVESATQEIANEDTVVLEENE